MSKYLLTLGTNYVVGHLRYGHKELELTEEEYQEYLNMNEDERAEYFFDEAELVIDDYSLEDYESYPFSEVQVRKIEHD